MDPRARLIGQPAPRPERLPVVLLCCVDTPEAATSWYNMLEASSPRWLPAPAIVGLTPMGDGRVALFVQMVQVPDDVSSH